MISQIYGILPSEIQNINIRDYQLLRNEYLTYRLLPQRIELQNACISYTIASMFGDRGMGYKDPLDFMVYSHKDKNKRMNNVSIMNSFRALGKTTKAREFTPEEIDEFNKLEALMVATGY